MDIGDFLNYLMTENYRFVHKEILSNIQHKKGKLKKSYLLPNQLTCRECFWWPSRKQTFGKNSVIHNQNNSYHGSACTAIMARLERDFNSRKPNKSLYIYIL